MALDQINDLLDDVATQVTAAGFVQAPHIMRAENIPSSGGDRMFSLNIQTTNTEEFRDRDNLAIRLEHRIAVLLLWKVKPLSQFTSQKAALQAEEKVIGRLLTQANLAAHAVTYEGSDRTLSPSGEYIVTEINFRIDQTWNV